MESSSVTVISLANIPVKKTCKQICNYTKYAGCLVISNILVWNLGPLRSSYSQLLDAELPTPATWCTDACVHAGEELAIYIYVDLLCSRLTYNSPCGTNFWCWIDRSGHLILSVTCIALHHIHWFLRNLMPIFVLTPFYAYCCKNQGWSTKVWGTISSVESARLSAVCKCLCISSSWLCEEWPELWFLWDLRLYLNFQRILLDI